MKKSKDYNEKYFGHSDRDREDDKVTGKLLKIAKKFECLSETVDNILTPGCWPGLTASRFMQDGCRTNGLLERAGALSKLFNSCNRYLRALGEAEKDIENRRIKVQKMLSLLDAYQVCNECQGERGELLGPNYWEDCVNCEGQGMIKKTKVSG